MLLKYSLAMLSAASLFGQTVPVDVDFKLTELERLDRPLAGVAVRLVLGEVANWQAPEAGHRFVTDQHGEARFTVAGLVDRRWRWVPIGMTGLSLPTRADHILIAAELEQLIPQADGQLKSFQWLHTMDIDCFASQECSSSDLYDIYTRDQRGRFTRKAARGASTKWGPGPLMIPELGGMALDGPSYKAGDFSLSQTAPGRSRWAVRLVLQRKPTPVRR